MPASRPDAVASVVQTMRRVLADLSDRIRRDEVPQDGPDAGYVDLIDVVGDLGRALGAGADTRHVRVLLPDIAAVREALEDHNDRLFGVVARTPHRALQDPKLATAYAAGALWACSSIASAFIDSVSTRRRRDADRASRDEVRHVVLELVRKHGAVRPADVRRQLADEGRVTHAATVSRAFADLIDVGAVRQVATPSDGDRRARYYGAVDTEPADDEARIELRLLLRSLEDRLGPRSLERVVREESALVLTDAGTH